VRGLTQGQALQISRLRNIGSLSFSFVRNGQGIPGEAGSLTRGKIKMEGGLEKSFLRDARA
jgi:hypothetical protein